MVPGEKIRGRFVEVSAELQRDFSLNQTLSLYLLEALAVLDRDSPTYALDVLTLVEAIFENPEAVLRKQLDQLKTEKMAELKAAGIEYEERIAELETLEWPKPNRDFIYATFNDFAERHPWVGEENVRPKSIAREMYEGFTAFNDYVRALGLERSEGVLLRYLSQVFKTLEQTVPAAARTDEVLDVMAHLRSLLRDVDSSLIEEWEALSDPSAGRRSARRLTPRRSIRRPSGAPPSPESAPSCTSWSPRSPGATARRPRVCWRLHPPWAMTTASPGRPSASPRRWRRSGPSTPSCSPRPTRAGPIAPASTRPRRASSGPSKRSSTVKVTRIGRSTASSI